MRVKCSWCPKRAPLGNYIRKYFIDGKYVQLCRDCHRRYAARTERLLER